MSTHVPPPPAIQPARPPADNYGRVVVVSIFGALSIGVWIWAANGCFKENHRVDELADRIFNGPSAVQISQVADQGMLQSIAYLSAAATSTAVFLVVALVALVGVRR